MSMDCGLTPLRLAISIRVNIAGWVRSGMPYQSAKGLNLSRTAPFQDTGKAT